MLHHRQYGPVCFQIGIVLIETGNLSGGRRKPFAAQSQVKVTGDCTGQCRFTAAVITADMQPFPGMQLQAERARKRMAVTESDVI